MEIVWYGHSCFRLKCKGASVVTDPCGSDVGYVVPRLRADIVTISREHPDYSNCGLVRGKQKIIRGPGEYEVKGVFVTGIGTPTKKAKKSERTRNTIYLFELDGLTVCHLGTLDHVPSQSQVQALSAADVLLVPVGGRQTIGASQAAEVIGLLEPRIVVPMHFKTKAVEGRLQSVSSFLSEMGLPQVDAQDSLVVSKSSLPSETQVVLLRYRE